MMVEDFNTLLQSVDEKFELLSAQMNAVSKLINSQTKNLDDIIKNIT